MRRLRTGGGRNRAYGDGMETVTWERATARRLARHGLAEPVGRALLAQQAGAICGVHAQVMSAAELSLALRVDGATRADVRAALWEERTLIKTYGPRGTVHLLPAAELAAWCAALDAIPSAHGALPPGVAFSEDEETRVIAAIADSLAAAAPAAGARAAGAGQGGAREAAAPAVSGRAAGAGSRAVEAAALTADELTASLAERCGAWAVEETMPAFQGMWPRWRQAVHRAAHAGALCFGPPRGRTVTFASPRRLVPGFEAALGAARVGPARGAVGGAGAAREAGAGGEGAGEAGRAGAAGAARWLVLRWLHAYGPATAPQFAKWAAAPPAWANGCFERLAAAGAIEPVAFERETAWVVAGDGSVCDELTQSVRLLPYFDAYGIGCHPRARLFPGRAAERALARGQAGPYPLLLLDGVVGGVWHQRRAGRRIVLTVEPLGRLNAARRRALEAEAERVAAVLEGRLDLTVGPVRVGAHA